MSRIFDIRHVCAAVAMTAVATWAGVAAAQEPFHVRGTLSAAEANALVIDTGDGESTTIAISEETALFIVSEAKLEDIAEGQFVGITSIKAGETQVALEVHIFSEDLRGLAEGHYPWDLVDEPNMMTNADVAQMVAMGDNRELVMRYKEPQADAGDADAAAAEPVMGETMITVSPDAVVVDFTTTTAEALAVGEKLFLIVVEGEDGSLFSPAVVIGQDGLAPPM